MLAQRKESLQILFYPMKDKRNIDEKDAKGDIAYNNSCR